MGKPSNSSEDIHAAARAGDLVAVQTIITSNPLSVNSRDKHSRTPLHLAAWAGQTQVVNLLCKNKADIGAAAMDDMGAIHFAAQKGHLEVIRTLISSGVSVKSANRKGMTPLHYAVQGSYTDLIKYLVKKGANINTKNKAGKSSLDLATTEEIRSLLTCPVEPKETDKGTDSKTEEGQPQVVPEDQTEACRNDGEKEKDGSQNDEEKEEDGSNKRKVEDDVKNEATVGTKKAKVALGHLLTSDDTQEEED
ncbi:putative NAD(+) ADP-ribosyltransferase [Helianthus annuus]|uniref:NAD(+) ADP-ribosyltransferase n=1 Tax=Helianthus annuus TaxID=4232 RepID=A0A251U7E5_HELAN|nr:putative ankyrin repeat protein RF_0381 [Helianthus annuus]KAF5795723.1 putative NAD(+) ADP-ribosyltransferase [Helianthus annuus]KAJ0719493.1 putative NAD(+) ADP-ribosyltransferase [Helianthus annuus]KAJ0901960.1 putative NAD(+) ADP-ribosyltransferase [Helianthus annuus]